MERGADMGLMDDNFNSPPIFWASFLKRTQALDVLQEFMGGSEGPAQEGDEPYVAKILTEAGGFPQGIEGPAVDAEGRLTRYTGEGDPLIYAGALIIDPAIFGTDRPAKFSLNACFNEAIERGRLHGMPMEGLWLTVGTPEAIGEAEDAMRAYRSKMAS